MKNLVRFFFVALLVIACKKDFVFDEYGYYGEGTAYLNGQPWSGLTGIFPTKNYCEPDTCIGVKLLYYNQNGALRGDITIDDIPLVVGKHTLNYIWPTWEDIAYRLIYTKFTSDGDVVTGTYHVFEQSNDNFLNITEINVRTGDIKGGFQAVVVRDSLWTPLGQKPDTIKITDGSFYGKIYWE